MIFVLILVLLLGQTTPAQASLRRQGDVWTSAVAYFNPNTSTTVHMTITYYPEDGSTVYPSDPISINPKYSGTVWVGTTPDFEGGAVVSTDVPILTVYRQSPSSGDPYSPILYTALRSSLAATNFYIPHVMNTGSGYTTRLGIQNPGTNAITTTTATFYSSSTTYSYTVPSVLSQASQVFLVSGITTSPTLPSNFDGSAVITGTSVLLASAENVDADTGWIAHSYEGAPADSPTIYIPTALCSYGAKALSTTLYVQNASTTAIPVGSLDVTYYNNAGTSVGTDDNSAPLPGGERLAINVCDAVSAGQSLSAVVTATQNLVAAVEIKSNDGLSSVYTSYTNFTTAGTGGYHIALPYVEWSSNEWGFQSTIYVMNTTESGSNTADITASVDRNDGTSASTTFSDLAKYAMVETTPNLVSGLITNDYRTFRGAVMFESSEPIMVVVNVVRSYNNPGGVITLGDSYVGLSPDET